MKPHTIAASVDTRRQARIDLERQVLRVPFALTRTVRPTQYGLRRVRSHEVDGAQTWSFDVVLNVVQSGDSSSADNYSAAVVELASRIDTRLSLSRRGPLRKPVALSAPELAAGTDALRRRFTVRGTSPELASSVLDDRLCAWLLGPGRAFHYEIAHNRVLAYGWRRYVGGAAPLRAALGLSEQLRRQAESR